MCAGAVLYWKYKDDPIGAIKVDKNVKRTSFHLPIIGSLLAMVQDIDNSIDLLSQELNSPHFERALVLAVPFSEPRIMIHDPQSIEYITNTNFENYVKGTFTNSRMQDVLGNGIFNSDGHQWYTQRKLTAKIMTNRNFKLYIDTVFTDNISILLLVLKDLAQNVPVDMHDIFQRYFMDSFGKIAYGIDINSLLGESPSYVRAFDRSQNVMGSRFVNPFFRLMDKFNYNLREDIKMIREFGNQVVENRKNTMEKRNDLLSLFMEHRDEYGQSPSTEELADHVISFILAGRDSTAQALSWTLYCLSKNPHAKECLLKEIKDILGDKEIPDYEQVRKMKYANAVFKETLRLYPSVPREGKVALQDDILPNGTRIPKGAIVSFYPYAMGRSEKLWKDAVQYKPERWLNSKQPSSYEYTAFMCGPRICLGKNLAELQGVFTLVAILNNFDFEIINPLSVEKKISLTLPMKNGLICQLTRK
ncbi:Protein kinase alk2 [Boothiomyces macroporosus]|uniref:Protein kinase alk2 n=2 Tax=Boothiomyces macroporosus TaxID=261099 RepID=A0AAD5UCS0_9FUNG|nr:Protein kinase alk2 [Boothiomyces macroporosus]